MAYAYKPMTNEQYCLMNTLYKELGRVASWSTMCDVSYRREQVMLGLASVRSLNTFMRLEVQRLEAAQ